jgi:quercetin dioxygenase-like cupin family protein
VADSTAIKVESAHSPKGPEGQRYLASGKTISMRLWDKEPPGEGQPVRRDYETVGYAIAGEAELLLEGQVLKLHPGSCWVVPKGAEHRYRVHQDFTAIEATAPPAQVHGRDDPQQKPDKD